MPSLSAWGLPTPVVALACIGNVDIQVFSGVGGRLYFIRRLQVYLFIIFHVQPISQGVTLLFFFAEKKKRSKKRKEFAFHLYYAETHHTKMNHKKQRQFPDAVFVFSDAVHAFRIPGVKSFLSLCLIISIITRAIITEQMSAIGCAKIRPSSPTNALAINSTGRKTNP